MEDTAETKLFTVFVTKYALTRGILETTVRASTASRVGEPCDMVVDTNRFQTCYHKGEWFMTLEEAQAKVGVLLARKRASIEKALMEFAALEESARTVSKNTQSA